MAPEAEVRTVVESNNNGNDINNLNELDLKNASNNELEKVANSIVSNEENMQQVKIFPEIWKSLNPEMKEKIAWELTEEIKDAIKELSDLWVEYSSEISEGDEGKIAALEFVRENREKIPQTWVKLEEKVNEVAKNIWIEVEDKGIIDKPNEDFSNS